MNANNSDIQEAAEVLRQARAQRAPVAQISKSHGILGLDTAYAVAEINTQHRVASGNRIVGKKVGLTSTAVQKQLGVDQPDFGVLFDDMEFLDGDAIPADRLIQPKAEAEVAFVVGRDITERAPTWSEFLVAIDYALPALEIVDSAIEDWKITLEDTVADNASCGLYVLGNQPVTLGQLQLGELGMQCLKNGKVVSIGSGVACLGHPLRAAWWLAKTLAEKGQGLRAGEVILSGALGPMTAIEPGDRLETTIGALGSVRCHLV